MLEWWMIWVICSISALFGYMLCSIFTVGRLSDQNYTFTESRKSLQKALGNRVKRRQMWRDSWKNY